MIYANGDVYEGEFSGDLANGKGKMNYVNGTIEEGNWANGVFKGNK